MMTKDEQTQLNDELLEASEKGSLEKVKELIEKGAEVDASDDENWNSLHWATGNGHLEMVKYLVEKGADVDARDQWGNTPLSFVSWDREFEVGKYLFLERNALMPIDRMFDYSKLMKEKMGRETEAQSILDYFLQNKSRYKHEEIPKFKTEFLKFRMSEEDSKNLKSIVKFL